MSRCGSCAKWEQAEHRSIFIRCPLCGRSRDHDATDARDRRLAQEARKARDVASTSEEVRKAIQAILDVYDEYVAQHGANSKHVYFIVSYRSVASHLGTTPHRVRKTLDSYDFPGFEDVLVEHGRGYFWFSEPPHRWRFFWGYEEGEQRSTKCA